MAVPRRCSLNHLAARLWFTVVLVIGLGIAPGPAIAQAPADPAAAVVSGQRDLAALEAQVGKAADDRRLAALREQALAIETSADAAASALAPRLKGIDDRLQELGPAPADARAEAPEVRAERQALSHTRTGVDGGIKQARLLSVAAQQAADQIGERRRAVFNQLIFRRGASPLSPQFWQVLGADLPADLNRLQLAASEEAVAARRAMDGRGALIIAASLLAAVLLLWPVRAWLEALGRRWAIREAPATRLRRSGVAMWRLLVGVLAPTLAALAILQGLTWSGALSARAHQFAGAAAGAVVWIAFVTSLGAALLAPGRASWRLALLSDETVRRARLYPALLAGVSGAGLLLERTDSLVGASLAATVATNAVLTLAYAAVAMSVLVAVGRSRATLADEGSDEARRQAGQTSLWSLAALAVALAVVVSLVAVLSGYGALGIFIMRQTVWISVLAAFVYLLLQVVDDLLTHLFSATSRVGRSMYVVFALRPSTIDQLGVLLSAVVRLGVIFLGISAVLAPFGAGAGTLAGHISSLASGVKIGGVLISPAAVLAAVAAFAIGVALVRGIQRWLNQSYLPRTEWDPGVRNSVSTAVGYLGVAIAAAWALASMGLGLQRVALIASALSVGIGFGLQQIVQNFISGVILLVERPVKVGDWVVVGGVEGDIQRINVRATEILMPDRSTVLLPNSEFITKPVQNKTRGESTARLQIQFGVAADADMAAVRDLLNQAFAANPDVLEQPAPLIFIDAVTETGIQMNSFAYVNSPRAAYPTRSALFFDILERLRRAGIGLAASQQTLRILGGSGLVAKPGTGAGEDDAAAPLP